MAEPITAASALAGYLKPEKVSGAGRSAGVTIRELANVTQLQVIARKGREGELVARIAKHLGRESPLKPLEGTAVRGLFIAATGPGEYWVLAEGRAARGAVRAAENIVGDSASVFDQSHGRFMVRLAGENITDVLAKGTPLDLRQPEFPATGAAHTAIAHIPALVALREEGAYDLSVARSYAGSFVAWLHDAARQYFFMIEQT